MRYRRVGIDILQVGLNDSTECTIYHRNGSQYQEEVTPHFSTFRHKVHGHTETAITTELHQYTGMKHGYSCRCRSMTVRTPCVEREQGTQHTESQEDKWEEKFLHLGRDVTLSDFKNVHGIGTGTVEDTQDTNQQEGRTTHEHQGELHGCIFLLSASPNSLHCTMCHSCNPDFLEFARVSEHTQRSYLQSDEDSCTKNVWYEVEFAQDIIS